MAWSGWNNLGFTKRICCEKNYTLIVSVLFLFLNSKSILGWICMHFVYSIDGSTVWDLLISKTCYFYQASLYSFVTLLLITVCNIYTTEWLLSSLLFEKLCFQKMSILFYFILLSTVLGWKQVEVIRRGNVFQQLMFLSGLAVNEQFYKLTMRSLSVIYVSSFLDLSIPTSTLLQIVLVMLSVHAPNIVQRFASLGLSPYLHGIALSPELSHPCLWLARSVRTSQ